MSWALITTFFCSFCAEMCAKIILIEKLHDLAYNGGTGVFFYNNYYYTLMGRISTTNKDAQEAN